MGRSPASWALEPLLKFATFSGRAPRAEFWWFYLLYSILSIPASFVDDRMDVPYASLGLVGGFLLPLSAVSVRRLHDMGRSGWWVGASYLTLLPLLAGYTIAGDDLWRGSAPRIAVALFGSGTIALAVVGLLLLIWFARRGNTGSNRYGPDPLDPAGDVAEVFS